MQKKARHAAILKWNNKVKNRQSKTRHEMITFDRTGHAGNFFLTRDRASVLESALEALLSSGNASNFEKLLAPTILKEMREFLSRPAG